MDPEIRAKAKEALKMYANMQMMAWLALEKELRRTPKAFTIEENNFIVGMCEESTKYFENVDAIAEDLLNDEAGLMMVRAGMRDHMEKFGGEV
jgi:hypothetical protein